MGWDPERRLFLSQADFTSRLQNRHTFAAACMVSAQFGHLVVEFVSPVSDQTSAAIQPMAVHPVSKLSAKIALPLTCFRALETIEGKKYAPTINSAIPKEITIPLAFGFILLVFS